MSTDLAPIALLVYARPEHTRKTLESLAQNKLAQDSRLFVFADGPKPEASAAQHEKIQEVRQLIRQRQWCGQVNIREAQTNQGLASSVIQAVTHLTEEYGKVIVLEDDLLLGRGFLQYMNTGLDFYANEPQVFGLTGYASLTRHPMPDSYFLPIMSSWGWGTWKGAWKHFEPDAQKLLQQIEAQGLENAFDFGGQNNTDMLRQQAAGRLDSWAVRFYASMFLKKGMFLFPGKSLVQNIGYDQTGTHCNDEDFYAQVSYQEEQEIKKIPVHLQQKWVREVAKARLAYHRPSLWQRAQRRLKRAFEP